MTSWFGSKIPSGASRKSPRPTPAPKQGLLNSGSLERPIGRGIGEMKLESKVEGLYNPLAWDSMPSSLREKFPHWKDSSCSFSQGGTKEDGLDDERAIYSMKNSKQPPCTIPYVVMDRDTIQGIAVKFETTPSEIARINKKPTLTFSIFPGDVLYVPDQDELAKLAPPPIISEPPVTSSISSIDSETTPTITATEGVAERERVQISPETSLEAADDHISILSKYISEDQGCIHGSLVVNKSTIMFTPNNQDPLVKEHGVEKFEIIIPIGDITYAAIANTVNPPNRCLSGSPLNTNETALATVSEEQSNYLPENRDEESNTQDNREKEGGGDGGKVSKSMVNGELSSDESKGSQEGERMTKKEGSKDARLIERTLEEMVSSEGGAPPLVTVSSPDDAPQVELGETDAKPSTDSQPSIGKPEEAKREKENCSEMAQTQSESADDMLAIMGAADPGQTQISSQNSESSDSVTSLDALLADSPYFLHLYVNPKSLHTYTYTPINNAVGIDIPRTKAKLDRDTITGDHMKKSRSLSPPIVHHVKNRFCFAVIDKRLDDLVEFISRHHPTSKKDIGPPTTDESWTDSKFEFINTGLFHSNEDLSFRDDHFQSSSWEIYSLKDMPRMSRIERMEVENNLPLPIMSETSDLLLEAHIRKLMLELPSSAVGRDWYLIYSTFRNGISLRTLYRSMMSFENEDSPILLIVRDEQKKLFGAAVTCRIRISEKFYGTGESYLFMFDEQNELKVFPWTGVNNYVVKGNSDSFSIGSGDGHPGLWLDESFYHGASYSCSTFNNECLASNEDFICSGVEAWGFL